MATINKETHPNCFGSMDCYKTDNYSTCDMRTVCYDKTFGEERRNMLNEIIFESWHKGNLAEFINFFRKNHFEEFARIYNEYDECLRGN